MFHGLSAFPLTPTDPGGRVRLAEFRRLLGSLIDAQVDSIGVLGSTGGYAYLEPDQRRVAVEAAAAEIAGRVPLIVGVSALRTDTACALARHARIAGADALLVAPMSYTPLTDDEVLAHYDAVARAGDLPVCVYNNPSTTHFTIAPDLLERLSAIPQVCAVKMPLPAEGNFAREIADLRARLPGGFSVGYSADWGCAGALLAGADAFYSVAAGIWPGAMLRLVRAARSGDACETARLDAAFGPLWSLFCERGSLRVVYRAAALSGLSDALPPRPVLPMQDRDDALRRAMDGVASIARS